VQCQYNLFDILVSLKSRHIAWQRACASYFSPDEYHASSSLLPTHHLKRQATRLHPEAYHPSGRRFRSDVLKHQPAYRPSSPSLSKDGKYLSRSRRKGAHSGPERRDAVCSNPASWNLTVRINLVLGVTDQPPGSWIDIVARTNTQGSNLHLSRLDPR
jgi:hypothetical protein